MGDPGSIPGLGRSPGEGNGNPLQYTCLENPMDGGALGYSPWGCKGSDTTEQLQFTCSVSCSGLYFTMTVIKTRPSDRNNLHHVQEKDFMVNDDHVLGEVEGNNIHQVKFCSSKLEKCPEVCLNMSFQ